RLPGSRDFFTAGISAGAGKIFALAGLHPRSLALPRLSFHLCGTGSAGGVLRIAAGAWAASGGRTAPYHTGRLGGTAASAVARKPAACIAGYGACGDQY